MSEQPEKAKMFPHTHTTLPVESLAYCQVCKTKTWHEDGVCEWSDGHEVMLSKRDAP